MKLKCHKCKNKFNLDDLLLAYDHYYCKDCYDYILMENGCE